MQETASKFHKFVKFLYNSLKIILILICLSACIGITVQYDLQAGLITFSACTLSFILGKLLKKI